MVHARIPKSNLEEYILCADEEVKQYLIRSTHIILSNDKFLSAIPGHLYYETADERFELIKDKMDKIARGIN